MFELLLSFQFFNEVVEITSIRLDDAGVVVPTKENFRHLSIII